MTDTALPEDPTLDEVRQALAGHLPRHASFDGWSPAAVDNAADEIGVDRAIARLAFAHGAVDMIDAWFADVDRRMADAMADRLSNMRVSARIGALLETRLDLLAREREALRRAHAILAMPQNLAAAARIGWRTVDGIWRIAGDVSTDYNHYTKRALLGGIYAATMVVFLDDESEGQAETRAFLHRRLQGVARFEKAKARISVRKDNRLSLSRFIGRLRYPAI